MSEQHGRPSQLLLFFFPTVCTLWLNFNLVSLFFLLASYLSHALSIKSFGVFLGVFYTNQWSFYIATTVARQPLIAYSHDQLIAPKPSAQLWQQLSFQQSYGNSEYTGVAEQERSWEGREWYWEVWRHLPTVLIVTWGPLLTRWVS